MRLPRCSLIPAGALLSILLFVASLAWMGWLHRERFVLLNDEGIYLEGGLRVMRGEVPYRDFFVLTGPGSFWLRGLVFSLFGATLSAARLLLVLEVALMTALTYRLAYRLGGNVPIALLAACAFLLFGGADPGVMLSNHRWDSSALALAAVAVAGAGAVQPTLPRLFAAGILTAAAAWVTPPLLLLAAALLAWLVLEHQDWKGVAGFTAGMAALSAPLALWLGLQGALWPMLDHLLWTGANYSGPNFVPYGSVPGGWWQLFRGFSGVAVIVVGVVVVVMALPALMPPANFAIWGALLIRKRLHPRPLVTLLWLAAAALVASTYPRWDISHLTYVAPLNFVLAAGLAARYLPRRHLPLAAALVLVPMLLFARQAIGMRLSLAPLPSAAGRLLASATDAAALRMIASHVRPGDRLFVFPYMPILYLVSGGRNVTRYSFLQPGMMTEADELTALRELRRNPPDRIIYAAVPEQAYLRIWPASDRARLRMPHLESYFQQEWIEAASYEHPGVRLVVKTSRTAAHAGGATIRLQGTW